MKNLYEIEKGNVDRKYGHLPEDKLKDWTTRQIELSMAYKAGKIGPVSSTEDGGRRKYAMMERLKKTLRNMKDGAVVRLVELEKKLEDPGLLENFEYFDIPSSEYMLQFYFAVWDGRIAEVMDFLHNYGKDLKGVPAKIPEDDTWSHMSYFEGMNIDKRHQAEHIVEFMKFHNIKKATSFGGGHVPERFYGLPKDLELTVFDNGPVCTLEELFPDERQRRRVNYVHELLSAAPSYPELLGNQELVWMHGVSMYLDEASLIGAIICAHALLQPNGYMCYDYLLNNESLQRAVITQGWPYDPTHPMTIFERPETAIEHGRKIIKKVNTKLGGETFMDIIDINVNITEPWGATSIYLTLQKHS